MAKKTLESAIGFNEIRNRLLFTEIALELAGADGDKEVAALGAPIGKLHTRWQDLLSVRHQQERQQIRANALCKRRNVLLDGVLKTIHNATLSAADQQRKATLFTHLFPKPLSTLTKPALEGQIKVAEAFVERLAKSDAHAALRKLYEKDLRASIADGVAALKERDAATATAAELTRRIDVLWADANAALQNMDGALKQLASKRQLGKEWVDSFFPDTTSSRARKPAAAPATPEKPTPAPAP